MGQNAFTQLNIGYDGNFMDETSITYPGTGPTDRRRARTVISGSEIDRLADIYNSQLSGTEYALPVRIISPWQNGLQYEFGFATLAKTDPETTVATFSVPLGQNFYMTGINCSADAVGVFKVYIDDGSGNQQVLQFRNNATNYNILQNSEMPMLVAQENFDVIVTAENTSTAGSNTFEATIIGYTQPNS